MVRHLRSRPPRRLRDDRIALMTQINLTGWRPGLDKVRLTKTLQAELGLSLSEAKHVTDRVLAGESVSLPVHEEQAAERLAGLLDAIGTTVATDHTPLAPK